jgi:hypothetical protein
MCQDITTYWKPDTKRSLEPGLVNQIYVVRNSILGVEAAM